MLRELWARRSRSRRIKAARAAKSPLREFVYLDEVSVYSLLASRQGALASEYTDTTTGSFTSELGSTGGVTAGFAKADVSSKLSAVEARSSQVVRKSTIQAAFKELREGEEERLTIQPIPADSSPPSYSTWAELEKSLGRAALDGWIIDPEELRRGQLVEVEIELEADAVFKITSMIAAVVSMMEENPELFPPADYPDLVKAATLNRVLDRLLVGLVPVRCRVVDYRVFDFQGRKMLVHNRIARRLPTDASWFGHDLYVVGVTEQHLFWQDLRRVLFAGSYFRMMCRLNHNGLRDQWVPVKLVDVLADIVPGLGPQIDSLGKTVFTKERFLEPGDLDAEKRMASALLSYGVALASEHGKTVDEDFFLTAGLPSAYHRAGFGAQETRKEAFDAITAYLADALVVSPDAVAAARLRRAVLADAGIGFDGVTSSMNSSTAPVDPDASSEQFLLDSEVVAIYW